MPDNEGEGQTGEGIGEQWARLRNAQEQLEPQRREFERLQAEQRRYENTRQQTAEAQRAAETLPNNSQAPIVGANEIDGLVNQFQYINLNLKTPKFTEDINPIEFVDEIERFIKCRSAT